MFVACWAEGLPNFYIFFYIVQSLVDVPCADLASALGFPEQKTLDLQNTLQRVLDRREEERQSKELLQLYLKVVEKERSQALQQEGRSLRNT